MPPRGRVLRRERQLIRPHHPLHTLSACACSDQLRALSWGLYTVKRESRHNQRQQETRKHEVIGEQAFDTAIQRAQTSLEVIQSEQEHLQARLSRHASSLDGINQDAIKLGLAECLIYVVVVLAQVLLIRRLVVFS